MKKSYTFKKKINRTYLILFIIIFGSFFVFTLMETINSSKALSNYQENEIESLEVDQNDLWDSEEHDLSRSYQFDLTVTILLMLFSVTIYFIIFHSKKKLQIDDKGMYIYGITGNKYTESYLWDTIDYIEIAYSQGLSSMFFEKSLIIHEISRPSVCVPLEKFENEGQIVDIIESNQLVDKIVRREEFSTKDKPLMAYFSEAVLHFKNNLLIYLSLSSIILVFASLNNLLNDTPISIIPAVASFYFGIKANIAMNIFSFESFNNNQLSFNESWEKTKGNFWRYFTATFIQGLFQVPFYFLGLYLYWSSGSVLAKGIMFTILGGLYSMSVLWLFLLPYIASITSSEKSFFSINSSLLKGSYIKMIPLVVFELARIAVFINVFVRNDFTTLVNVTDSYMLINVAIDFVKIPLYSAYIMNIIHKAPFLEAGEKNSVKEAI